MSHTHRKKKTCVHAQVHAYRNNRIIIIIMIIVSFFEYTVHLSDSVVKERGRGTKGVERVGMEMWWIEFTTQSLLPLSSPFSSSRAH
jgi:hypothetical protein